VFALACALSHELDDSKQLSVTESCGKPLFRFVPYSFSVKRKTIPLTFFKIYTKKCKHKDKSPKKIASPRQAHNTWLKSPFYLKQKKLKQLKQQQ